MGYHMTFWYMYTLHCSNQGKRTYFLCGMCVHTHGWRSKNNFQELALPSDHWTCTARAFTNSLALKHFRSIESIQRFPPGLVKCTLVITT